VVSLPESVIGSVLGTTEVSSGAASSPRLEQPIVTKTRAEARDREVKRFTHLFWLV